MTAGNRAGDNSGGDNNDDDSGDRARGLTTMGDVYNNAVAYPEHLTPFQVATVEHLFAHVWTRPGLAVRDRRLLVIGITAMLSRADLLELQFRSALDKGELTPEQVHEAVLQIAYYAGWPLATAAHQAAQRALEGREAGAGGPEEGRDERAEVVTSVLTALGEGRYDDIAALLTDDAEFHSPYMHGDGEGVRGRDEVVTMLGKFIGRGFSSITFTVDRFHLGAEPDSVVAEYRSTGTVAGSGASYANTYAGVFRVVGGRLAFWREFYDTQRAAAAAASFRKP